MSKITYKTLNSANIKVDNSSNIEKIYDIEANANINNYNEVSSIDSGIVIKNNEQKATFNIWSDTQLNVNFYNSLADEQCNIIHSINQFVEDTKDFIKNNSILTLSAE